MPERTEETRVTRLGGGSEAAVTQEAGAELSGVHRLAAPGQRPGPLLTSSSATPLGGSLGPTGSETCPPRLLPCVSLTLLLGHSDVAVSADSFVGRSWRGLLLLSSGERPRMLLDTL